MLRRKYKKQLATSRPVYPSIYESSTFEKLLKLSFFITQRGELSRRGCASLSLGTRYLNERELEQGKFDERCFTSLNWPYESRKIPLREITRLDLKDYTIQKVYQKISWGNIIKDEFENIWNNVTRLYFKNSKSCAN